MENAASLYNECYEVLAGTAIKNIKCDGCGNPIELNAECVAAVLLPSTSHFNYEKQKPIVWANEFIKHE